MELWFVFASSTHILPSATKRVLFETFSLARIPNGCARVFFILFHDKMIEFAVVNLAETISRVERKSCNRERNTRR